MTQIHSYSTRAGFLCGYVGAVVSFPLQLQEAKRNIHSNTLLARSLKFTRWSP